MRMTWSTVVRHLSLPLALLAASLAPRAAAAQQGARIVGTVTDSASGLPIAAVQVTVAGTRLGALTRPDGGYAIAGIPAGTYTVEARRIGFAPQRRAGVRIAADSTVRVDLRLERAVLQLQEVVTTGVADPTSGTRTPFTVDKVNAAEIPVPPTNAVEALAGRVAGATIVAPGRPGGATDIQLRVPASISKSNAPLIVVDGVILGQTVDASTVDLNSLDIESLEIVKGAAAASLYGSRASNGVIQIRTRRGSELAEGRTRITLRSEYGSSALQEPIRFSRFSAFRVANGEYVDTLGQVVERANRSFLPASQRFQDQPFPGGTYDQIGRFFDAGQFSQSSLTISRNQGLTNFLATVSTQGSDGVIADNGGYQRNDVRLNLDQRLRDDLTFGISTYYSRSHRDDLDDDLFFDLVQQAPDIDLAERDSAGTLAFQPDQFGVRPNPLYSLSTQAQSTRRTRLLGSFEARYAPLSWLSFNGNTSFDRSDRTSSFFMDRGIRSADQAFDAIGGLSQADAQASAFNASGSANLLGRRGALTTRSSLRALVERETSDRTGVRGSDLLVPGVSNINSVRNRLPVSDDFLDGSQFADIRTNSYIATLGSDYGGRYIAEALVRRDGSSLFGPEERWQTYYRGSAAWRMAEESWWPFKRQVGEFKPRLSRGTAGGRPDYADQFETYDFTALGGLTKATLGNPLLKPELATETEAGLDLIFYDRVSLQTSYARTVVTDQLVNVPLAAPLGGFQSQWQNAGTIKGKTYEATLEAQVYQRTNLGWSIGLVADRTRHRITEFNRSCFSTGPGNVSFRCANETLGTMYGSVLVTDPSQITGLTEAGRAQFQRNDEGLLVPVGPGGSWRDAQFGTTVAIDGRNYAWGLPLYLQDSTGNPAVARIGDGNPTFRWGFTNNVRWRGVSVFTLLDAQVGGDVYNRTKQRMYQNYRHADVDQAGKPAANRKPHEYYDRLYNGNNVSAGFVEPGGYLKLRELAVRYKFGQAMLRPLTRTGVGGVTVGLIGRNLFTSTDYSGYDPEVGTVNARVDNFAYPRFRTVTGTIEVEF